MFCPKCGKQLPENSGFCDACGQSVSPAPQPQGTPYQPQPQDVSPQPQPQPQDVSYQPQPQGTPYQPQAPGMPAAPAWTPAPVPGGQKKRSIAPWVILPIVLIVGVLAVVLMLTMVSNTSDKAVVGTWRTELDMTDIINQGLTEADAEEFVKISDFSIALVLELKDDGTYAMSVDRAALEDSLEDVKRQVKEGITGYLEDLIEEEGLDMTVDEALFYMDMSLDDLVDSAFDKEDIDEMADSFKSEGQYKARNGKFYTSDSLNEEPGLGYESYTLEDDVLTLDEGTTDVPDEIKQFVPMRFVRVK